MRSDTTKEPTVARIGINILALSYQRSKIFFARMVVGTARSAKARRIASSDILTMVYTTYEVLNITTRGSPKTSTPDLQNPRGSHFDSFLPS
jgi:hypothetical protein